MEEVTIDASKKSLGRLATEVAMVLMGKNKPSYQPYKITGDKVKVVNIDKVNLTGKKTEQNIYYRHTGYPGGVRSKKVTDMSKAELFTKTIYNMLPKNKLRKELLKRLTIE